MAGVTPFASDAFSGFYSGANSQHPITTIGDFYIIPSIGTNSLYFT